MYQIIHQIAFLDMQYTKFPVKTAPEKDMVGFVASYFLFLSYICSAYTVKRC